MDVLSRRDFLITRLRINSVGGDAGVALLIHNRLQELADSGVKLSCTVDGVTMSGGSLIMCACDNVSVNPASLIMVISPAYFFSAAIRRGSAGNRRL